MVKSKLRRALIVVGVAVTVVVAIFVGSRLVRSAVRTEGGPLGEPAEAGVECVYAPTKALVSFGAAILANPGDKSAVIEAVTVNRLRNVHLVGPPQIVPQYGDTGVGVDNHYPPTPIPGVEWAARTAAVRAVLPGRASIKNDQNVFDLVVGVARDGSLDGSFAGVTIDYRVGAAEYVIRTKISVIVYGKPCVAGSPSTVPYPPDK